MSGIARTRAFLEEIGLPSTDSGVAPTSPLRFPDGGQWRVEIPSVEGPNALRTVFAAADEFGVPVHRVSQGSGVMLLTDRELDEMAMLRHERGGMEIQPFVGPARAGIPGLWPTCRQARSWGHAFGVWSSWYTLSKM
ncbi:MAG: hypothetical protein R2839_05710 [Thermomicrobiales bacterium]